MSKQLALVPNLRLLLAIFYVGIVVCEVTLVVMFSTSVTIVDRFGVGQTILLTGV